MYTGDLKFNFSDYFFGAMFANASGARGGKEFWMLVRVADFSA